MNVTGIAFGAESGDDGMLKEMNKKNTTKQNMKALNLINNFCYKANTGFVIGYPGETKETLRRTCDTIAAMRQYTGIIDVYPVIPYPGTHLWQLFEGKFQPDLKSFDWSSLALRSDVWIGRNLPVER